MAPHLVQSIKNASRVRHVSQHAAHAKDVESARFLGRKHHKRVIQGCLDIFALYASRTWAPKLVQSPKNACRVRNVSGHA